MGSCDCSHLSGRARTPGGEGLAASPFLGWGLGGGEPALGPPEKNPRGLSVGGCPLTGLG